MRLTAKEAAAIRAAAAAAFGPEAVVRLFGSRLDDDRRGGDIDLHIALPERPASGASAEFRRLLDRHVGEREYDILISTANEPLSLAARKAVAEGVLL